jgi:hypothetical protein
MPKFKFLTVLAFFALFALIIIPSSFASQLENDGLVDGYTPAEIQRNIQRKALGMPPIPPRAQRKKSVKKPVARDKKPKTVKKGEHSSCYGAPTPSISA